MPGSLFPATPRTPDDYCLLECFLYISECPSAWSYPGRTTFGCRPGVAYRRIHQKEHSARGREDQVFDVEIFFHPRSLSRPPSSSQSSPLIRRPWRHPGPRADTSDRGIHYTLFNRRKPSAVPTQTPMADLSDSAHSAVSGGGKLPAYGVTEMK